MSFNDSLRHAIKEILRVNVYEVTPLSIHEHDRSISIRDAQAALDKLVADRMMTIRRLASKFTGKKVKSWFPTTRGFDWIRGHDITPYTAPRMSRRSPLARSESDNGYWYAVWYGPEIKNGYLKRHVSGGFVSSWDAQGFLNKKCPPSARLQTEHPKHAISGTLEFWKRGSSRADIVAGRRI